jgi:hypothetical protein
VLPPQTGINREGEVVDLGTELSLLEKSGSHYRQRGRHVVASSERYQRRAHEVDRRRREPHQHSK